MIPVMVAIWGFSALRFNLAFSVPFLIEMGKALPIAMGNTTITLGLSFANPAYHQKSAAYMINIQIVAFIVIGTMVLPDVVLDMPWLQMPLAWAVGLVLLYVGYRKLSNME